MFLSLCSFDEMGKYDIPACIEYVVERTGFATLSYVGHSMGCGTFYMALHHRPELSSKINAMVSLAPAASFARTKLSVRHYAKLARQFFVSNPAVHSRPDTLIRSGR